MRALVAACALAFALTVAYAAYLQPEWEPTRDDQYEYLSLARGLALRGEFTRAMPGESFYPEWLRSPGYPLALAPLCATVGCTNWPIAIAQGLLFAALVALTYAVARQLLTTGRALVVAALTAAYPLIAYYAALPLSDVLAATLFVAAVGQAIVLRSRPGLGPAVLCGALAGALALTRPAFIPFALVLAALALPRARQAIVVVAVAALVLAPWVMYAQANFSRPLLGNSGAVLWIGYFQGKAGGSAAARDELRNAALASADDAAVARAGARLGLDSVESTEAAAAIREIAAFESSTDRLAQAHAYGELNGSLTARTLRLVAHDPLGWIVRGLTVRSLELLAHDEPYRVRDAPTVPLAIQALFVAAQLVFLALAIRGLWVVAGSARRPALVIGIAIGYVWLSALPFQTESRYALPVRPFLLVLAVAGATALRPPRAGDERERA